MKILVYIVCILGNAVIITVSNSNGILLGAIPTIILFTICMIPAWAYGKHYDRKKYTEKYPSHSLQLIQENVYRIQNAFLVHRNCFYNNGLIDVNEIFNRATEQLTQQTEEENLKNLIKSSLSPVAYAVDVVNDCAYDIYCEKRRELKGKKDKLTEIKAVYFDFWKLLNNMALQKEFINDFQYKIIISRIEDKLNI